MKPISSLLFLLIEVQSFLGWSRLSVSTIRYSAFFSFAKVSSPQYNQNTKTDNREEEACLFWLVWIRSERELRRSSKKFFRRNFQIFQWLSSRLVFTLLFFHQNSWSEEYKEMVKAEEERRKAEEERIKASNTTAPPKKVKLSSLLWIRSGVMF